MIPDTSVEPTTQHPLRNEGPEQEQEASKSYALSGKIMLASIVVLFVVVLFLVLLHLYARWYLLRLQRNNPNRRRERRNRSPRVVFYVDSNRTTSTPTGGLDPSILKSLPVFTFSSKPDTSTPECAVCLSEFETGETGRVLPKCKHSFHTECIDMWFHSNSTCPLCRSTVEPVHSCEPVQDVKILIEPGSSRSEKNVIEPGSSNVNETVSVGDRRKGVDISIDVPSRSELRVETGLRIMSPSQGFRSPRIMLMRILTMSRKSPAVSPSGVGPSFLAPTTESNVELASESTR